MTLIFFFWQTFFIRERDEKLRNILVTAATNYTDKFLLFQVETEKREKRPKEMRDELEDENKGLPKQDGEVGEAMPSELGMSDRLV